MDVDLRYRYRHYGPDGDSLVEIPSTYYHFITKQSCSLALVFDSILDSSSPPKYLIHDLTIRSIAIYQRSILLISDALKTIRPPPLEQEKHQHYRKLKSDLSRLLFRSCAALERRVIIASHLKLPIYNSSIPKRSIIIPFELIYTFTKVARSKSPFLAEIASDSIHQVAVSQEKDQVIQPVKGNVLIIPPQVQGRNGIQLKNENELFKLHSFKRVMRIGWILMNESLSSDALDKNPYMRSILALDQASMCESFVIIVNCKKSQITRENLEFNVKCYIEPDGLESGLDFSHDHKSEKVSERFTNAAHVDVSRDTKSYPLDSIKVSLYREV